MKNLRTCKSWPLLILIRRSRDTAYSHWLINYAWPQSPDLHRRPRERERGNVRPVSALNSDLFTTSVNEEVEQVRKEGIRRQAWQSLPAKWRNYSGSGRAHFLHNIFCSVQTTVDPMRIYAETFAIRQLIGNAIGHAAPTHSHPTSSCRHSLGSLNSAIVPSFRAVQSETTTHNNTTEKYTNNYLMKCDSELGLSVELLCLCIKTTI